MNGTEKYQTRASQYAKQLRDLIVIPAGGAATRSAAVSLESIENTSDRLTRILEQAGSATGELLDAGDRAEQEAAELRLLAQAAAEIKLARGLLQTAHDAREGDDLDRATRAAGGDINQTIEEVAALLESPLGTEFQSTQTRGMNDRPQETDAAKADLKSEAERTLKAITKQATRVSGQAVQALVAFDPAVLKKGLAGFSQDAADVVDTVVSTAGKFVRRIVEAAMRLLLQAHEWVLKILGKDLEGKARKQIEEWLDRRIKGEDEHTIAERVIQSVFSVNAVHADLGLWLKDTGATVPQINQAAEAVEVLADRFRTKAEQVEKFLKGIGLLKLIPIAATPQVQMVIAGVTGCLFGYLVYTGYDHVDSGRVVFMERFGVSIPDRVQGVRATVKAALAN